MPQFLLRLSTPPTADDPEQARIARQLYYLAWLGILITAFFLFFDLVLLHDNFGWSDVIISGTAVVMALLVVLLRQGYIRLVSVLMILNALIAIMLASFRNVGVRNPAMLMVPLLLMLCSVLMGSRVTTLFAMITGAMATVLYLNERSGVFYPQPPVVDADYLFVVLVMIGITTVILHFTVNQIVQSAQQIRQQAAELQDKNQRLEQIQATLEARTQQLSKLNAELQLEMTERARTEAALRQQQKLESMGLLAGGVAHDFNNLLTSILSQSGLALRRLAPEHLARQHIDKAIQSTQRAADLTRQLLAYAGKATFQIEPVDLNQLIKANSGLLETVLRRNATLHLELDSDLPAVAADRGQLQQVLMNLAINAAEAIDHEHGEIRLKTHTVELQRPTDPTSFVGAPPVAGSYVCLEVIDNGVGMGAATLEKIFDPFFSTKARGHGLGLSAVLGVVQALHGGLQVQSEEQIGTTFCVYLPATAARSMANSHVIGANVTQPNGLVLVIDDEEPVREAVAEMLTSVGYRTAVASNGADGIALFQQLQNQTATVLLDVVMPGMSGIETLQKLRTMAPEVQVILSSGYVDTALPVSLLTDQHTAFLAKPYTLEQLLKAMANSVHAVQSVESAL